MESIGNQATYHPEIKLIGSLIIRATTFCQLHNPWSIREDLKELAGKNYIVRFTGTMITINMQF
jgi:hypothetical protein